MKISVALAQATQRQFTDDLTGYAEEIEKILSRSPGTQMVVHPELHLFGSDMSSEALQNIAQSLNSKFVGELGEIAKRFGIWLIQEVSWNPRPIMGSTTPPWSLILLENWFHFIERSFHGVPLSHSPWGVNFQYLNFQV